VWEADFFDRTERPTWREWRRHVSRRRWEKRLGRAPYVVLGYAGLLVIATAVLVWALVR
jgi:hypothetical protein